jgi:hypothetical protein
MIKVRRLCAAFFSNFNLMTTRRDSRGSGATLSKTWLLNDVKPTAQRSLIDVATNRINPVGSAFVTGTLDKIK